MLKKLEKILGLNPLDRIVKSLKSKGDNKILLLWNRGLGDIPLWLYGMTEQIKSLHQRVELTVLTREDLKEGFYLLDDVNVLVSKTMERGKLFDLEKGLNEIGKTKEEFHFVFETIEPKAWLKWQRGWVTPKLNPKYLKADISKFTIDSRKKSIAVHLNSETGNFYNYDKNWGHENFRTLFKMIKKHFDVNIILFGLNQNETFDECIDLRGKTSLFEMAELIKSHTKLLIAPDSGILNVIYYLNEQFSIDIISLWGNPSVGILKQKVKSPNKLLRHDPIIGKNKIIKNISIECVLSKVLKIMN